jgi:hypothetical protein
MPIPHPTQTPQEQLVERINLRYHTVLTPADVEFGIPVQVIEALPNNGSPGIPPWNATVQMRPAEGVPYEFNTTLHFTRLPLTALFAARSKVFQIAIPHTHSLLPQISSRLGFTVRPEDIVGHSVELSGLPKTMWLMAAETSLLLFGQVEITLTAPSQVIVED